MYVLPGTDRATDVGLGNFEAFYASKYKYNTSNTIGAITIVLRGKGGEETTTEVDTPYARLAGGFFLGGVEVGPLQHHKMHVRE